MPKSEVKDIIRLSRSYRVFIENLTNEERGKLLTAIYDKAAGETVECGDISPALAISIDYILKDMERLNRLGGSDK